MRLEKNRIKKIRKELGITRQTLANQINRDIQTVKKYETFFIIPPDEIKIELSRILKTPLTCLFYYED